MTTGIDGKFGVSIGEQSIIMGATRGAIFDVLGTAESVLDCRDYVTKPLEIFAYGADVDYLFVAASGDTMDKTKTTVFKDAVPSVIPCNSSARIIVPPDYPFLKLRCPVSTDVAEIRARRA